MSGLGVQTVKHTRTRSLSLHLAGAQSNKNSLPFPHPGVGDVSARTGPGATRIVHLLGQLLMITALALQSGVGGSGGTEREIQPSHSPTGIARVRRVGKK